MTAILVASCDKYSDLWGPYFVLFRQHWPDCPYDVYLGTDALVAPPGAGKVTMVHSGMQQSWTRQVRLYLEAVSDEIVLFSLEDFLLRNAVATIRIQEAEQWFRANPLASSLRLNPIPPPDSGSGPTRDIGEYSKGARYRISTQAAFWRRKDLIKLLAGDKSPWEFETDGQAAGQDHKHFGMRRGIFPYPGILTHHVVEKGMWIPHELWQLRRKGLIDGSLQRPVMDLATYFTFATRVSVARMWYWMRQFFA